VLKEGSPASPEFPELNPGLKIYLARTHILLGISSYHQSLAGISHDRSIFGMATDLTQDVLDLLIQDDELVGKESTSYEQMQDIGAEPIPPAILTETQRSFLTRATVFLKFSLAHNAKKDDEWRIPENHPICEYLTRARDRLTKIVSAEEVEESFRAIEGDRNSANNFYQDLRLDLSSARDELVGD